MAHTGTELQSKCKLFIDYKCYCKYYVVGCKQIVIYIKWLNNYIKSSIYFYKSNPADIFISWKTGGGGGGGEWYL